MKILKEEKGSTTLFVLIAMLFFIMYLVGMYVLSANTESSQIAEIARIKEIYEQGVDNIDDVYTTIFHKKSEALNGYTADGLILYYDFKQLNGVQDNVIKDLSENGNDGIIYGASIEDGALKFDGVDDWVAIKELDYPNITIEVVMEYSINPGSNETSIVENFQSGGYGISTYTPNGSTPYNKFVVNVDGNYKVCSSDNEIEPEQKYSLSGSYNNKVITLFENGSQTSILLEGTISEPMNNTIMALGTNPDASVAKGAFFAGKIYSVRIYNRALTQEEVMQNYNIDKDRFNIEDNSNKLAYITDGLILHYDGLNKAGKEIQNKTIWKDLSGNGNDGNISGATWNRDSISFDGIDDWVAIKELNYPNITLEAVIEYETSPGNNEMSIVSNFESGGYALSNYAITGITPYNKFTAYIDDTYYSVVSSQKIEIDYKYFLSGNYDGNVLTLSENGEIVTLEKEGSIKYPNSNTIMALGTNPNKSNSYGSFLKGKIYSIRIYNRALTKEEILQNYEVDKLRFKQ